MVWTDAETRRTVLDDRTCTRVFWGTIVTFVLGCAVSLIAGSVLYGASRYQCPVLETFDNGTRLVGCTLQEYCPLGGPSLIYKGTYYISNETSVSCRAAFVDYFGTSRVFFIGEPLPLFASIAGTVGLIIGITAAALLVLFILVAACVCCLAFLGLWAVAATYSMRFRRRVASEAQ